MKGTYLLLRIRICLTGMTRLGDCCCYFLEARLRLMLWMTLPSIEVLYLAGDTVLVDIGWSSGPLPLPVAKSGPTCVTLINRFCIHFRALKMERVENSFLNNWICIEKRIMKNKINILSHIIFAFEISGNLSLYNGFKFYFVFKRSRSLPAMPFWL